MTEHARTQVPTPRPGGTRRRRLLTGPNPRLLLTEHARQDKQLLATLSRARG